jgi:carbonic anhydrase
MLIQAVAGTVNGNRTMLPALRRKPLSLSSHPQKRQIIWWTPWFLCWIEFGVLGLEVRHIVILGHAQCGGITASLSGSDLGQQGHSFVDKWVGIIDDARDAILAANCDDPQHALELETVRVSLANLRTFPFITEREKTGFLKLHGAYFGIAQGELHILDEATGMFEPQ